MSRDWTPAELARASATMKANGCMSFEDLIAATNENLQCFYYTFGSDPGFPYRCGWVIVAAANWEEAHRKFRTRFPDRCENALNCAFFYDAERWKQMDPEHTWPGWKCFEIIS